VEQRHAGKQVGSGRAGVRPALASLAALGLTALGLAVAGCSAPPVRHPAVPAAHAQGEERIRATYPPIEFVSPRDAIVRLMSTGNVTCTGTLIQDDLVVTAHHCVSARDKKGRVLDHDLDPAEIQVELGGDELPWGEVKVRAIVAPKCGYVAGDGDIAILVLERHLVGMPTYTVHIESPPKVADQVAILGFGRCALSSGGIKRHDRPDAKIDAVSFDHFEAQASICPGDSGGPVLDSQYHLVGVISASVMDGDETTADRSLFTRLDTWPQLFAAAHEISNGASPGELPPYGECRPPPPPPKKTSR
jgi:secreted trypsin-like serine protease